MRLANSKNLNRKTFMTIVAAIALAGCQSTPENPNAGAPDSEASTDTGTYAAGEPNAVESNDRALGAMATNGDAQLLNQTIFYFDFDKALIKPEVYASLKAHARKLASNASLSARIEGHADERGTREYNVALGERRGNAISKFLRVNGVSNTQIEVISYGEETPVSDAHNDNAWSENRRVEIKY